MFSVSLCLIVRSIAHYATEPVRTRGNQQANVLGGGHGHGAQTFPGPVSHVS
jgi:hypothetical protein